MKNIIAFTLLLTVIVIGSAQNVTPRRPFKPVTFTNFQPLWYTTLSDSSLIDKTVRRNHRNAFIVNDNIRDLEVQNRMYYCLFIEREADFEGSYLGTIDTKTGKRLWSNYFSLATQDRQEFTQTMLVTDDEVELLGMKTQSLYGSGILGLSVFDSTCWMTKRIYDSHSGNLIVNLPSDPSDPNTQRVAWGGSRKRIKYSQIFKMDEDRYRYVHHHKVRPENTIDYCDLNEKGIRLNVVKSIQLNKRLETFNYFHLGADRFLLIDDDFVSENNKYTLYFLNADFDTLRSVRTADVIPRDAYIEDVNTEKEYITIYTTTYDPLDSFRLYPDKIHWIVDFDGKILKKVKMDDDKGKYMIRYAYVYDKTNNDLIVAYAKGQGLFDPPKSRLQFYRAKGESNFLELKSELAVEDSLKVMFIRRMTRTMEGNLILLWDEVDVFQKNDRYDDIDLFSVGTSYICFDPKTLGLVSSVSNVAEYQNIKIYPNPATSTLSISCHSCAGSSLDILDLNGTTMLQTKLFHNVENTIDVSSLDNGMYIYQVRGLNNIFKVGKWIKI